MLRQRSHHDEHGCSDTGHPLSALFGVTSELDEPREKQVSAIGVALFLEPAEENVLALELRSAPLSGQGTKRR